VNLARRPFVNTRPLTRLVIVLWVAGAALLAWNLRQPLGLWGDLERQRSAVGELVRATASERERIAALETRLTHIDFEQEAKETEFLNAQIAARTFSWTRLFERLAEVLPREVRLVRISPRVEHRATGPRRVAAPPVPSTAVALQLGGVAARDEALLDFVDALFAHPAFDQPDLQREQNAAPQAINFDLSVLYYPQGGAGDGHAAVKTGETAAPSWRERQRTSAATPKGGADAAASASAAAAPGAAPERRAGSAPVVTGGAAAAAYGAPAATNPATRSAVAPPTPVPARSGRASAVNPAAAGVPAWPVALTGAAAAPNSAPAAATGTPAAMRSATPSAPRSPATPVPLGRSASAPGTLR